MADTEDLAPSRAAASDAPAKAATTRPRRSTAAARRTTGATTRSRRAAAPSDDIDAQVGRLQDDVKSIMQSLTRLGNEKVGEVQGRAKRQYASLVQSGEGMLENVQDEFEQVEQQIKDTIRQKPLTAVLSAAGIGFLIAILTR